MTRSQRWSLGYAYIGAVFGWVWLLSIAITVGLVIRAVFFDGAWLHALTVFITGGLGKWLLRGFNDHAERVTIKAYLIDNGASKRDAREIWLALYQQGGSAAARQIFDLNHTDLVKLCRGL